jgi:hypothetical protein
MVAYFIGLQRGITGSRHLYDEGWIAAEEYFRHFPELLENDELDKYDKAKDLVKALDQLFNEDDEDDDGTIDCGEY